MCNRATLPDVLGVFVMFKKLAAIPSIVGYRKILLIDRTRSHDVAQRHFTYDDLMAGVNTIYKI